jgi:hypothetical protein
MKIVLNAEKVGQTRPFYGQCTGVIHMAVPVNRQILKID